MTLKGVIYEAVLGANKQLVLFCFSSLQLFELLQEGSTTDFSLAEFLKR